MVSETTIIPQEIKVDGVTIDKNGSAQLQIKQSSGNPLIKDIALNELNITVLEVNASLSSVNDDFVENFIDADGVLGLVDTGNTTADYDDITDKNYTNGVDNIVTSNMTALSTTSSTYILAKTLTTGDVLIPKGTGVIYCSNTNGLVYSYYKFNYTDATSANSNINSTNGTTHYTKDYINPNPSKTVASIDVYHKGISGLQTSYIDDNIALGTPTATNKEIYLNYNKAKPTKTLLSAFSDDTGKADVGTYTYELVHIGTAETTGELNPDIENTISMTNTPDRMIIHQKDTAVSKIKKFVLAVWE